MGHRQISQIAYYGIRGLLLFAGCGKCHSGPNMEGIRLLHGSGDGVLVFCVFICLYNICWVWSFGRVAGQGRVGRGTGSGRDNGKWLALPMSEYSTTTSAFTTLR